MASHMISTIVYRPDTKKKRGSVFLNQLSSKYACAAKGAISDSPIAPVNSAEIIAISFFIITLMYSNLVFMVKDSSDSPDEPSYNYHLTVI
jgi:hypothetical protein